MADTRRVETLRRHLDVPGLVNFRDLGDYPARDYAGNLRRVKPGVLFRAGHFHDVDSDAARCLARLGIQQVFDFRTAREREKKPSRFGVGLAPDVVLLELDPGSGNTFRNMMKPQGERAMSAMQMKALMADVNRSLVTDHAGVYRRFLAALLENPVCSVMHCASGKDRTGIAAALLLTALGVAREIVLADYLLTNQCLDVHHHVARAMADFGENTRLALDAETMKAMYEVHPEYLQAAFDTIDQQWGSTEAYLQECLGIGPTEREQLQSHYLQH